MHIAHAFLTKTDDKFAHCVSVQLCCFLVYLISVISLLPDRPCQVVSDCREDSPGLTHLMVSNLRLQSMKYMALPIPLSNQSINQFSDQSILQTNNKSRNHSTNQSISTRVDPGSVCMFFQQNSGSMSITNNG